jgi:hypothetical protein
MSRQLERELERLENELERCEPEDVSAILAEIRELSRELANEDQWREHGRENGWEP